MFEDILDQGTVTIDNIGSFYCDDCNCYFQVPESESSESCPICDRLILKITKSYTVINKHNDYYGTTVSC